MRYCCAFLVAVVAITIGLIHYSPPYLATECLLFNIHCPVIDQKLVTDDKHTKLQLIAKSITHWIESGEEIASQISIRSNTKETFNFYATDTLRTGDRFDDRSLCSIFSNGKVFEALFIAIAVDRKWIASYDDAVRKYWPRFPKRKGMADIQVKDVLRHEAGLCVYQHYRVVYDPWNINIATYDILRHTIEDERITYYDGHRRRYHTLSRGHNLNELFHAVEPRGSFFLILLMFKL